MKTKQICALALMALTFFGFSACKPTNKPEQDLKLEETSVSMKVGETHQLVANITVDTWASSDETVATVAAGLVTAVKEGTAIISATAGSQTKTCVISVTKDGQQGGDEGKEVKEARYGLSSSMLLLPQRLVLKLLLTSVQMIPLISSMFGLKARLILQVKVQV